MDASISSDVGANFQDSALKCSSHSASANAEFSGFNDKVEKLHLNEDNLVESKVNDKNREKLASIPLIPNENKRAIVEDKKLFNNGKYSCKNCLTHFKNSILLKKHMCEKNSKGSQKQNKKAGVNRDSIAVQGKVEPLPIKKSKSFVINDSMVAKQQKPRSVSCVRATGKENKNRRENFIQSSPTLKVLQKFSCKNCNLKFTTQMLLDIHVKRHCMKPMKKVLIQNSPIPGLHTMLSPRATIDKIINSKTKVPVSGNAPKCSRRYKDMGGIPAPPRLRLAFEGLIEHLQNISVTRNEISNINKQD